MSSKKTSKAVRVVGSSIAIDARALTRQAIGRSGHAQNVHELQNGRPRGGFHKGTRRGDDRQSRDPRFGW